MPKNEVDFSSGFEGELEIRFVRLDSGGERHEIRMWSGYFDQIIALVEPENGCWSGLAKPYHLHEGWYEGHAWQIPDLQVVLAQLEAVSLAKLGEVARNRSGSPSRNLTERKPDAPPETGC